MKESGKVHQTEIEPKIFMDAATRGGTSITNLDKLIEAVGSKTVDCVFTDYVMRKVAKAKLLDKIQEAVDAGADIDVVKGLLYGTNDM